MKYFENGDWETFRDQEDRSEDNVNNHRRLSRTNEEFKRTKH